VDGCSHIDEVWNGINNLQVLVEEPSWQAYLVIRKQTKLLRAQQVPTKYDFPACCSTQTILLAV
jgi:hypothetical protein